jgi:hypothetical protein
LLVGVVGKDGGEWKASREHALAVISNIATGGVEAQNVLYGKE